MRVKGFAVKFVAYCLFFLRATPSFTQEINPDSTYLIITAGSQYTTSPLHQRLWGNHYRRDWNTPVKVKLFYLDTAAGGLKPYQSGGGRQSKTLRLHNSQQREYVLRSIDKTFGRALPDIYQNTFVEKMLNDQVSIAQPFAAVTIPGMAEAAKIYHTWPQIVFVPQQKALDTFNQEFSNRVYLFEQRPDESWEDASNFGSSKKIISTEKLLEKISEDANHRVDQIQFVRSRLFDMFIGDWGRHEDQWRWASFKEDGKTIYKPIPRDRDQVYTKFDGLLIRVAKAAAGAGHLQTFDHKIKDITTFNFPARNLDRRMANETTLQQWIDIAKELQQVLTDEVITTSVQQLPPEMFANSGVEIIAKLKTRREDLVKYASAYYLFLAREVDVAGTKESDHFEIVNGPDGQVSVKLFSLNTEGAKEGEPFYSKNFLPGETKEIRLYGLAGKDNYEVSGTNSIKLRIIGGDAEDVYKIDPQAKVHVYDSKNQPIENFSGIRLHLSADSVVHAYTYDAFKYDKKGLSPAVFYNRDDRIFIGLNYKLLNNQWRKSPFGQRHKVYARYSINQQAISLGYEGLFNQIAGNWNLLVDANYDMVRWTNFYGLGNETIPITNEGDFYRIRSKEVLLSTSFQHVIGKQGSFGVTPFYQSIQLRKDEDRFLHKTFFSGNGLNKYDVKNFGGMRVQMNLQHLNNLLLPTKGVVFSTGVAHVRNISQPRSFTNYSAYTRFYLPFLNHFVLSIENGAAAITGEPEFYQLNSIGGSTLRGYRRERFWGETIYHNNNELQYLFDMRSHLFNGKMGVLAFADQGRVWKKGEHSDAWHYGYGGGIIVVPFHKLYFSMQYGISTERRTLHLELRRVL
jgi:hypothetical protein